MTRQELAEAIKSVLAENTKSKLNESAIRQAVREVLAEEEGRDITVTLTSAEVSAILDALASSNIENNITKAGQLQGGGNKILANLAHAKAKLTNAYEPNPQADLADRTLDEEEYDFNRDARAGAVGKQPTGKPTGKGKVEGKYAPGKKKQVVRYEFGKPVEAWVWE
jgi:hypothetical protein